MGDHTHDIGEREHVGQATQRRLRVENGEYAPDRFGICQCYICTHARAARARSGAPDPFTQPR